MSSKSAGQKLLQSQAAFDQCSDA